MVFKTWACGVILTHGNLKLPRAADGATTEDVADASIDDSLLGDVAIPTSLVTLGSSVDDTESP